MLFAYLLTSIHFILLDTGEMDSNGDQEFDSSYFFPPSQHPITFNDTFEIPVHKSMNPSYPPVIDSDAVSLNEGSFTTQEVGRNVTTGSHAEGSSPVDIGSFSQIPPLIRETSLSEPHLFSLNSLTSPGKDISPVRIERNRSLSDSCLTRLTTGTTEELQAQVSSN